MGKDAPKETRSSGRGPKQQRRRCQTPSCRAPCHGAIRNSEEAPAWGQGARPVPQRPDSDPPYSRHHQGQAWQCQTDGPRRESLAGDKQDVQMVLRPRGSGPHGHHRDRSQPQAEAQAQDPRRRPSLGLGPRAAQRTHRGLGVASSQRCPRPGAPAPTARSHTHFLHRRGPPSRTHVSGKRGKRSGTAGLRGSHIRVPGECPGQVYSQPRPVPPGAGVTPRGRHSRGPTTHSRSLGERPGEGRAQGVEFGPGEQCRGQQGRGLNRQRGDRAALHSLGAAPAGLRTQPMCRTGLALSLLPDTGHP